MAFGEIAALDWTIRDRWLELRQAMLFDTQPSDLASVCERIRQDLAGDYARAAGSAERRRRAGALLVELTLDLRSHLAHWRLLAEPDSRGATAAAIAEQTDANEALCRSWSPELADRLGDESAALRHSNLRRIAELSEAGELANPIGNDSPHGVADAIRRGAILVTTNPVMANSARKVDVAHWAAVAERARTTPGEPTTRQRVLEFTLALVLDVARELRPIHRASAGRFGHVTYQVDPHASADAAAMVAEAEHVWQRAGTALGGQPNLMFKIPGTEAGLDAADSLASQAIPIVITASCSVAQHLAFARRVAPYGTHCLLVQMNGRLDESVAAELAAAGVPDGGAVSSHWASTAIVRRSYRLLHQVERLPNAHLLVASLRGPWHVSGALTASPEPIYVTAFPDQAARFDAEPRQLTPIVADDVPPAALDRLRRSQRFLSAYEPDGMEAAGFASHHTVAQTLDAFRDAHNELASYLR